MNFLISQFPGLSRAPGYLASGADEPFTPSGPHQVGRPAATAIRDHSILHATEWQVA